jgi:hypothetical protein
MPDVNDAAKLGSGKEMQERLPNLENAGLFSPATFPLSQITDEQGNQQGRTAKGDPGHTGESFIMHVAASKTDLAETGASRAGSNFHHPIFT